MMKLLYIPTGNVFTLPDEIALKHYKSDKENYKILDAGFVDEEAPVQLPPQTVQELVMQQPEQEKEEVTESVAESVIVEEDKTEDLMKMSKDALLVYCRKLGIKGMTKGQKTKKQMIEAIQNATMKDVLGE